MRVGVGVLMPVAMFMLMLVLVRAGMGFQVDVEVLRRQCRPWSGGRRGGGSRQRLSLRSSRSRSGEVQAQVQQRAQEHVAADAAKKIKVNRFHVSSPAARALIWLAA